MYAEDGCTVPTPLGGALRFTHLSVGSQNGCGISTTGSTACWGEGWLGTLGNDSAGTGVHATRPTLIAGNLAFQSVSHGAGHVCGLTRAGAAYCWGNNFRGRLGIGSPTTAGPGPVPVSRPYPVVGGLRFVSLAAGWSHTCALTESGEVWCWGLAGALGRDMHLGDAPVPVRVSLP